MSINPDNVNRTIRQHRRADWWGRNGGSVALAAFTLLCALGLIVLMVTPR